MTESDCLTDFYDAIADGYATMVAGDDAEVDILAGMIGPGPGHILDVGTGIGRIAIALAKIGWTVTGIDISPQMLERAAARVVAAGLEERVHLVRTDLFAAQFASRFDVVLAIGVLYHLPDRETQAAALRRMADFLAADGRLIVDAETGPEGGWGNGGEIARERVADGEIVLSMQSVAVPADNQQHGHLIRERFAPDGRLLERTSFRQVASYVPIEEFERLVARSGLQMSECRPNWVRGGHHGVMPNLLGCLRRPAEYAPANGE